MLGGIAFMVGSVCDTVDGRYSRVSGKGSPSGAFLDSTLDRVEEGVVLTAVAANFSRERRRSRPAAVVVPWSGLADGLLHSRPGRGARRGVQSGIADRAVRVVILSAGLCSGTWGCSHRRSTSCRPSAVTVVQRIWHVRSELTGRPRLATPRPRGLNFAVPELWRNT